MYFVVERYVPGLSEPVLRAIARRTAELVAELNCDGCDVSYHGSTALAGDDICFCLFSSARPDAIDAFAARFGGHERITAALHTAPSPDDATTRPPAT